MRGPALVGSPQRRMGMRLEAPPQPELPDPRQLSLVEWIMFGKPPSPAPVTAASGGGSSGSTSNTKD